MIKIDLIDGQKLKPHERTRKNYLEKLARQIKRDDMIKKPVLIDKKTLVILDGHHRVASALLLGWTKVPANLVNYSSRKIQVSSWRKNIHVTKSMVLQAGLSGKLLKPKTSRHKVVL